MVKPLSEVVSASYKIFLQKVKVFSSTQAFLFAGLEAPPVSLPEIHQARCHRSCVRTIPGQVRRLQTGSVSSVSTVVLTDTIPKEEWWQTRFFLSSLCFFLAKANLPKHIKIILVSLDVTSSLSHFTEYR